MQSILKQQQAKHHMDNTYTKVIESIEQLSDEELGGVVNMALCKLYKRNVSPEFLDECLSDMANWALYGREDCVEID